MRLNNLMPLPISNNNKIKISRSNFKMSEWYYQEKCADVQCSNKYFLNDHLRMRTENSFQGWLVQEVNLNESCVEKGNNSHYEENVSSNWQHQDNEPQLQREWVNLKLWIEWVEIWISQDVKVKVEIGTIEEQWFWYCIVALTLWKAQVFPVKFWTLSTNQYNLFINFICL